MINISPVKKARITSLIFALAGILSYVYFVSDLKYSLPLLVFYFTLVFNTYFSIKLFSGLVAFNDTLQNIVDAILFFIYLSLAISFGNISHFILTVTLLFIVASVKYSLMLFVMEQPKLLKRKILVDIGGIAMCFLSLSWVMLSGNEIYGTWALAVVFVLSNVVLFTVYPLYRLDK